MRATLTMTLNDLRIFLSRPGTWLGLVLLPILFTVGLGFAFSGGDGPETLLVDVIDEDKSERSAQLIQALAVANDALVLCPIHHNSLPNNNGATNDNGAIDNDGANGDDGEDRCELAGETLTLERGQERVREGVSEALIVIPSGYGEAVASLAPVQIDFYSTSAPTSPDLIRQTLDALLLRENTSALTAGVADAVLARLGEAAGVGEVIEPLRDSFVRAVYTNTGRLIAQRPPAVEYEAVGGTPRDESLQGFNQSVPGVGSMYVMFTVLGGMVLIQRERQRWTLQRLAVLPLTRGQILGGKILTYFLLGMFQYFVVFAVGLVVGLDFGPSPLLLLPTMAAFVLCCTALTFAIAPSLHSEGQANVVTQLLSLTFAALGGAWWPLEIVPEFMQRIGHLTPVAWVMDAFHDLLFYGGGMAEIAPELGVLLAAAAALFGVGIWRFRYT